VTDSPSPANGLLFDPSAPPPALEETVTAVVAHFEPDDAKKLGVGSPAGIDPLTILTIIQVIVSVIQMCRQHSAADLHKAAVRPNPLTKFVVRRVCVKVVRSTGTLPFWDAATYGKKIADALLKAAAEAGVLKVGQARDAVMSLGGGDGRG
jgi:hypothetical protein